MVAGNVVLDSMPVARSLVPLDEAGDPSRCGRKAAALATLRKAGFDVPDGFVVPVGASPSRAEIASALARLGDGPVAVRSSGAAEDLEDASFAGQYDTVLDVRGVDAVLEAAARCMASATEERVAAYGGAGQAMAVLVQVMVPATAAGVAFSANPLTGDRDEVRVSATRGLGDRLAAGEVDGDEWSVRGEEALPLGTQEHAIDPAMARRIAELARRCEAARGAPQDIEWALLGDQLHLLQSRPITVLPIAPAIELPKGTWMKDAAHFPEPISPFAATTHMHDAGRFFDPIAEWGALPDGVDLRVIGHEVYTHVEPDDGGKDPPPWWVLAAVVRIVPALRRKLAAAEHAIREGWLESVPRAWADHQRAAQREEIERRAAVDLAPLDDDALLAHIDELTRFCGDSMTLHFKLFVPYCVGVHELVRACADLLGWDAPRAVRLLQGLSSPSVGTTRDLATVARRVRDRPRAAEVVAARRADVAARLDEVDPEIGAELRGYLAFWGLRPFATDAGAPTVAERPQLVANLLADLVEDDATPDLETPRQAAIAAAREALIGDALARFDAALAFAEIVYAVREDNVLLTDQLPTGLLRRAALEAGQRLVARGWLGRKEDVVMLTRTELTGALRAAGGTRAVVARRKAEHAWVRARPGPMVYGPPPGKMPSVRGLPAPARRINEALLWIMEQELSMAPRPAGGEGATLQGVAASPGVHRGRVRVVRSPSYLDRLRQGEVLVCPITTAAWMMAYQRAGALVTDAGSVLSHTAIVAREYGLPAVVATGSATTTLADGDLVEVDGNRGTVTRLRG
jgi:phosphohistidine swiveling domain-containing protein